jgi:transposase
MKSQCRSFSSEFKHEAACLVLDQECSIPKACRSLNLGEAAPGNQVQQLRVECESGTPVGKTLTAEQKRIQELAARAHRLEREKPILSSRLSGYPLWASAQLMKQERILDCI